MNLKKFIKLGEIVIIRCFTRDVTEKTHIEQKNLLLSKDRELTNQREKEALDFARVSHLLYAMP